MTCTCLWNHTATGPRSIHQADARCPVHNPALRSACERAGDYNEKETING